MARRLSEQQLEQYRRDGLVFPLRALEAAEAAELVLKFEALRRRMDGWSAGAQILKPHLVSTWAADLVRHPRLLDAVEDLIGPDILCWTATFFAKRAESPGFVGWHQDLTYWGLEPADKIVTAWLGLTESRRENGCMRVVPGSHAQAGRAQTHAPGIGNMLMSEQDIALGEHELASALDVELQAGEFSIHHAWLVHGSQANPSPRPRIGLSINYMAAEARQAVGAQRDSAMLVRGADAHGHFDLEPQPQADFDDAARAAHRKAMASPSGVGRAGDHPRNLNRPEAGAELVR